MNFVRDQFRTPDSRTNAAREKRNRDRFHDTAQTIASIPSGVASIPSLVVDAVDFAIDQEYVNAPTKAFLDQERLRAAERRNQSRKQLLGDAVATLNKERERAMALGRVDEFDHYIQARVGTEFAKLVFPGKAVEALKGAKWVQSYKELISVATGIKNAEKRGLGTDPRLASLLVNIEKDIQQKYITTGAWPYSNMNVGELRSPSGDLINSRQKYLKNAFSEAASNKDGITASQKVGLENDTIRTLHDKYIVTGEWSLKDANLGEVNASGPGQRLKELRQEYLLNKGTGDNRLRNAKAGIK